MTAKNYLEVEDLEVYKKLCRLHKECIRMLNGLEKTLERKIPEREQRWQIAEEPAVFGSNDEILPHGWPAVTE